MKKRRSYPKTATGCRLEACTTTNDTCFVVQASCLLSPKPRAQGFGIASILLVALALAVAAGCTRSNPFVRMAPDYGEVPQETLAEAVSEIETAVKAGNREPDIADRGGVVVNTPEMRQAIKMRAARAELLSALLDAGHAWELSSGLVATLRTKAYKQATTRQERNRNALLVMNENENRWTLYEGLRKASKFPPRSLSAVQQSFFEARIKTLSPGQKYEGPDGETLAK
ncbi:MAG: DUF1318 domain-containing protein [bacterium]|nr:DUF1318 domain-containing protein [bacterium]